MPNVLNNKDSKALLRPGNKVKTSVLSVFVAAMVVAGGYLITRGFAATNQLYLTPSSGTVLEGNTVDVAIHEDSGSVTVNAVQANLSYDPSKLQFVSISSAGSAFPLEAQSTGGSGTVQIARAINGGTSPLTGDQLVATVTFKALVGSTTAAVSFGSGSAVVSSTDNTNILVSSGSASFDLGTAATPTPTPTPTQAPTPTPTPAPGTPTPTPPPTPAPNGSATMYLSPASGSVSNGANLVFDIHENSGSTLVNAVQANYDFSTSQFQFVSIDASKSDFGLQAEGTGDGGHIKIARGVNAGSPAISGDRIVATVTLRGIGSGSAAVTPAAGSAVVDSVNNKDILAGKTGGTYTLSGGTGSPGPTPHPTPVPVPVSVTGSHNPIPVKKTIQIASPALQANGGTTFQVDGQDTSSTIDTTQLSDGNHTVTATSSDGQTVKQTISVQNHGTPASPFSAVLAAAKPAAPYAGLAVLVLLLGWVGFVIFRHSQAPGLNGPGSGGNPGSQDSNGPDSTNT